MLVASGEAGERAGRADLAYGGWANAACIAVRRSATTERALEYAAARHGRLSGAPTVEFQMAGLLAYALARLGRHDEARARERPPGRARRAARLAASSRRWPTTTAG